MPLQRHAVDFPVLSKAALRAWSKIPTTIATDAMNRAQAMVGAIKPVGSGMRVTGQARTLGAMVGDNGGIHAMVALARPGEVLVVDAGGYEDVAVFGGVLARAAIARRIAGVVLDGATRDVAELRALGFPVFCRAVVPGGPHKGFGGVIDGRVSVGGVPVDPGDVVLGDDDGVVVVPLARAEAVLAASKATLEKEKKWMKEIAAGRLTVELMGIPDPEVIGK